MTDRVSDEMLNRWIDFFSCLRNRADVEINMMLKELKARREAERIDQVVKILKEANK